MNREQKAEAIAQIATQIQESEAVIAVDYRGISVTEAAELRTRLRESDASFRIVKNTLTERAADQADAAALKELLQGPTALTFVRGDAAAAAKALADFQKSTDLLAFKGGVMGGEALDAGMLTALSKLPSRDVLYQQLVGIVASPITGLARSLNGLLSGLAVALGGVLEKKESGEIPAGEAPAAAAPSEPEAQEAAPAAEAPEPAEEAAPAAEEAPAAEAPEGDQDAEAPEPAEAAQDPAEGPDDSSADAATETDTQDTQADAASADATDETTEATEE
jgi:large subunit ribosomal protein L10